MCTVTFIPVDNGVILTSNRDEKIMRSLAHPPSVYKSKSNILIYPKDSFANGTWICLNDNGNAAVLLNGAFYRHESNPPYRKSRGLVLLDIIDSSNPLTGFDEIDLRDIEPFTIVLYACSELHELRWDGARKFANKKDTSLSHIWNSATLYDENVIELRKSWFESWKMKNEIPTIDEILNFHKFTGDGNSEHDLMMSKEGMWSTVSITSLQVLSDKATMIYEDLLNGLITPIEIVLRNNLLTNNA